MFNLSKNNSTRRKKILASVVLIALILVIFLGWQQSALATQLLFDRMKGGLQNAVDQAYGGGQAVSYSQPTFAQGLIIIINFLLTFIGLIFFVLLLYAGYLWMMAKGEEQKLEEAKNITREAVMGLIVIIIARVLTEFILTAIGQVAP